MGGQGEPTAAAAGWRLLPIAVIGLGFVLALIYARDLLSFEALKQNRADLLAWRDHDLLGAAAIYFLVYTLVVAFSAPGAIWMTLGGGFLFGVGLGAPLAVTAATLGATLVFLAARTSLGELLRARAGPWLGRLSAGFEANAASFMLMMRLIPAVPFFIANLAPAFLGARLSTFVWTTFLGIMPGAAVFAWIGAGLGAVIDRGGQPDLGLLFEPRVIGPILALAALSGLPILLKTLRPKQARALGEAAPAARPLDQEGAR